MLLHALVGDNNSPNGRCGRVRKHAIKRGSADTVFVVLRAHLRGCIKRAMTITTAAAG